MELAHLIREKITPKLGIELNSASPKLGQLDELYPSLVHTQSCLGVIQTCSLDQAIDKTWRWFSGANA